MKKITNTTLKLAHEDCWTYRTLENVNGVLLNEIVYPEKNLIIATILFNSSDIRNLIKRLKDDKVIKSVKVIHVENNYVIVEIKTIFQGTISKLLYEREVAYFQNLFDNNREIWNIIYNDKSLIDEIRNEGKVIEIKSSELSLDTIMKVYYNLLLNNLSPRQLTVLKTAYNMGYFNFPRKVRVNKLSSLLGISETTVIQHIRSAEHEILRKLVSSDNQD